jgi:hypothetical protein
VPNNPTEGITEQQSDFSQARLGVWTNRVQWQSEQILVKS